MKKRASIEHNYAAITYTGNEDESAHVHYFCDQKTAEHTARLWLGEEIEKVIIVKCLKRLQYKSEIKEEALELNIRKVK